MSWLKQTFSSSIGGKSVVALTGLGMTGFVGVHLSGNFLVYAGPEAMAHYAEGLRTYPLLLLVARSGLLLMTLLHIGFAIKLNLANKQARPVPYTKKDFRKASFASRQMVLTGLLILFYICFHLAHFTWRLSSEFAALGPWDCYRMVVMAFQNPLVAGVYIAFMIVLGMHLSHGLSSLFQTLGLKHLKYNKLLNALGPVLGTLLALGYISIPVSVLLGILQ